MLSSVTVTAGPGATQASAASQTPFNDSGCQGSPTTGVTPTTITLATCPRRLSGPIADIYSGAVDTEQAFVKYINAHGGVDGRKLVLKVLDDGLNPSKNAAATRELASQVFAFRRQREWW